MSSTSLTFFDHYLNRVFLSLSTFWTLVYFRRGLFYSFLSIYLHFYLEMSVTEATLFGSTGMISSALFQSFLWGKVADMVHNRKRLIVWGEIIAAGGYMLIWYLHILAYKEIAPIAAGWVITVGLFGVEAFWSASNVGWSSLISDVTPEDDRSSLMGRLSAIGGMGRIAGAAAAAIFFSYGGFRGGGFYSGVLFGLSAFVIVLSAIIIQFCIKDTDLKYRYDQDLGAEVDEGRAILGARKLVIPFDKKFFFMFIIGLAAINIGRNAIVLIKNIFLVERFNAPDEIIGALEILTSVSTVATGLLTPYMVGRLGDWKLYLLSGLVAIAGLIGFVFSPHLLLSLAMMVCLQFAMVTVRATTYSIISKKVPAKVRGRYFGYYNTVFFLSFGLGGTVFAAPIVDILQIIGFDVIVAYQFSFTASALLVVVGLLLTLYLYFQELKKEEEESTIDQLAEIG